MAKADRSRLISFNLDPVTKTDPIRLHVFNDNRYLKGLVTNTHSWLCKYFLKNAPPTPENLKYLLGPNYDLVTLEFVYPVQADQQTDVLVQLLVGTNVVTVRSFLPQAPLLELTDEQLELTNDRPGVKIAGNIDVSLYDGLNLQQVQRTGNGAAGLAYGHHHLQRRNSIQAVRADVAKIILDPDKHMTTMSNMPHTHIHRVHKSGPAGPPSGTEAPVKFKIKGRPYGEEGAVDDSGAELRCICQCHLPGKESRFRDAILFPCVKPAGTYTDAGGNVVVTVDTMTFVDYAADPTP
jgi:hypothetical protein